MKRKYLKYWELPKPIQEIVNNYSESAFWVGATRKRVKGTGTLYLLEFKDSFERWFRVFDSKGRKVGETTFYPIEQQW